MQRRWWGVIGVVVIALVAGTVTFVASRDGGDTATPPEQRACARVLGTATERLRACLATLGPVTVSPGAAHELDGTVLVAGEGITIDHPHVPLARRGGLQRVLIDDDESRAADTLRAAGIGMVVVHDDVRLALDRDDRVIARLANHDYLERFQLRWVTTNGLVYEVRGTSLRIDDAVGDELLAGLRARLAGTPSPAQSWQPSGVRLIAAMRLRGQRLVLRHAAGESLEPVLDELARKLRTRWQREVETLGLGPMEERLSEVRLEIHAVRERATVDPRNDQALFEVWEPGIDGVTLTERTEDGERFGYLPGSEATTHNVITVVDFLDEVARAFDWPDVRAWRRRSVKLTVFRDEHFMDRVAGGGGAVRLVRGNPVASLDDVTDDALQQMLFKGAEWWLRNQLPDGSFQYKYWPEENRFSAGYNEVRHLLAARDLTDAWRYKPDPRYLDGARRAMDWLLRFEVTADDPPDPSLPSPGPGEVLYRYPQRSSGALPNQKLGTVVVALLGWINWAEVTGSHAEDERIKAMARYALSRIDDDGRFRPYDVPPDHPYYGSVNDIVPGEAALALGRVAEYFGDRQWVSFFPRFLDYYESWFRERTAQRERYGRWPEGTYANNRRLELVQFGPWAVMACRQYFELTGDERAARFGLEIGDWIIDNYQWSDDRAPWPDFVGGYYKLPWELPAMQAFVYGEGTAAAYTIATTFRPSIAQKYDEATRQTLRFLRVMQYDDLNSYFAPRPELVRGAVRYAMNEPKIRIDYLGHAMSTLTQVLDTHAARR